jgi:hypothetical protein
VVVGAATQLHAGPGIWPTAHGFMVGGQTQAPPESRTLYGGQAGALTQPFLPGATPGGHTADPRTQVPLVSV